MTVYRFSHDEGFCVVGEHMDGKAHRIVARADLLAENGQSAQVESYQGVAAFGQSEIRDLRKSLYLNDLDSNGYPPRWRVRCAKRRDPRIRLRNPLRQRDLQPTLSQSVP